ARPRLAEGLQRLVDRAGALGAGTGGGGLERGAALAGEAAVGDHRERLPEPAVAGRLRCGGEASAAADQALVGAGRLLEEVLDLDSANAGGGVGRRREPGAELELGGGVGRADHR